MKSGDFVNIYTDPLTCQDLEGKARLVLFIDHCFNGLEMWEVEFKGECKSVIRFISSISSPTEGGSYVTH